MTIRCDHTIKQETAYLSLELFNASDFDIVSHTSKNGTDLQALRIVWRYDAYVTLRCGPKRQIVRTTVNLNMNRGPTGSELPIGT